MKIRTEQVSKIFTLKNKENKFTSVQPINIEIAENKMTAITGRSGSGKSTLLNMLSGILTPTSGKVFYDDKNIYDMNDKELSEFRSHHIGIIPQGQTAVSSLTVLENICLPAMLYKTDNMTDIQNHAFELMNKFGIATLRNKKPCTLSGGELRRMFIARSMIKKPDIIFADEPTNDLDNENTKLILNCLKETTDSNTTVVIVTHDRDITDYSDINYTMDAGILENI